MKRMYSAHLCRSNSSVYLTHQKGSLLHSQEILGAFRIPYAENPPKEIRSSLYIVSAGEGIEKQN